MTNYARLNAASVAIHRCRCYVDDQLRGVRSMRVLIIEDNVSFAHLIAERLQQSGFDSDQVGRVEQARQAIGAVDYAAIVLDLGLPDASGLGLFGGVAWRGAATTVPI